MRHRRPGIKLVALAKMHPETTIDRLQRESLEGDPCERQHPFGVGNKGPKGSRRTSKDVLSRTIECRLSAQPMFDFLGLAFAKGTRLICKRFEEIGESFHQRSVTDLKACKEECILTIANGFPIFRPVKTAIHPRCPRIS